MPSYITCIIITQQRRKTSRYTETEKQTICKPGCGKWCIPDKSRPREMVVSEEQGWSILHQEDQRKESWEFHCGKELMVPQNHHHNILHQKFYLHSYKKVETTEKVLMLY